MKILPHFTFVILQKISLRLKLPLKDLENKYKITDDWPLKTKNSKKPNTSQSDGKAFLVHITYPGWDSREQIYNLTKNKFRKLIISLILTPRLLGFISKTPLLLVLFPIHTTLRIPLSSGLSGKIKLLLKNLFYWK